MTRKRKIAIGALGALLGLGIAGYLGAPAYVRYRVHADHPDVTVDRARLRWGTVKLYGVHVRRDWITADFIEVVGPWDASTLEATGGDVTVDLDKKPKTESGEKRAITVRDVAVHMTKGNLHADLTGALYESGDVSFASATVTHPKGSAKTGPGSLRATKTLDYQMAKLDWAEITPGAGLSHVPSGQVIRVEGVELGLMRKTFSDLKLASAEFDVLDPMDQATHVKAAGVEVLAPPEDAGHNLNPESLKYNLSIKDLTVKHPWISPAPVTFHNIDTALENLPLGKGFNPTTNHVAISVSGAILHIDPTDQRFLGEQSCQEWAEAFPDGLRDGPLAHPSLEGNLYFDIQLKPKPSVKLTSTCKSACYDPSIVALKHSFTYTIYDAGGHEGQRTAGPDTPDWVPIKDVTSYMPLAVMEMEDRGFMSHHGFLTSALENSLDEDLKKGKFIRGGSTITMQLAKNLWLKRHKTLGRKAEELLLTQVLESCFTKDQLMELYLNVVELGPNLYGLGPAAKYYFKTPPQGLGPAQTFYLASLLPNPRKAPPPTEATMARMGELMRMLVSAGRLPDGILLSVQQADTTGWEQP